MSSRNKTLIAISFLIEFSIIAGFSLYVASRVVNGINDKEPSDIIVSPFLSRDVWGVKIETANKSRQFFAGIQRQIAAFGGEVNDSFSFANTTAIGGKTLNNMWYYKFEIAKLGILIKVIRYEHPGPEERDDLLTAGELRHLNYVVESSTCRKCSKDDAVLLGQNSASDSAIPGTEESYPKSVFGLLIQIDLK